jgi:hypothetical protein
MKAAMTTPTRPRRANAPSPGLIASATVIVVVLFSIIGVDIALGRDVTQLINFGGIVVLNGVGLLTLMIRQDRVLDSAENASENTERLVNGEGQRKILEAVHTAFDERGFPGVTRNGIGAPQAAPPPAADSVRGD